MNTRFWVKRLGMGLFLGAAIASLDFAYYLPLSTHSIGVASFLSSLVVWCGESLLFVLVVTGAEYWASPRELRAWELALVIMTGALFAVLAWQSFSHFLLRDQLGVRLFRDYLGTPVVWIGGVLYHTWLMLFFGGLGWAAYVSQRRYARMLATLRTAELSRATSQRRLADAKLASLQARIDPDFLVQTLAKLERFYEADPASADQLLDELIAFLRGALADIRSPSLALQVVAQRPGGIT